MFTIETPISDAAWDLCASEASSALRTGGGCLLAARLSPPRIEDLWYCGPEAVMTFRDAEREARIEGSMRWLELGLRAWLRSSSSVFIVAGESVWQTPDIVLTPIDDDLELNFRYRRPIRLRAAMPEVRAAVVDWTSRFAAEYERRLAALV